LGVSFGAKVARLERLRMADDVVMAYEVSVLPQTVLPDPEQVAGSLYEYLALTRQTPVRALQHIRALNAPLLLANRLGIPDQQAVLFITRTGYLSSGQPVEYTLSYCRSDYYDFVAELKRDE
jgi:GntR family transcriptional regulator